MMLAYLALHQLHAQLMVKLFLKLRKQEEEIMNMLAKFIIS